MEDVSVVAIKAYESLGALGFLIVAMALAFCFLVWRVVKTQDKISQTLDSLFAKSDAIGTILAAHDRQGQEINDKIGKAEGCLTVLKTQVAEIKGRVG